MSNYTNRVMIHQDELDILLGRDLEADLGVVRPIPSRLRGQSDAESLHEWVSRNWGICGKPYETLTYGATPEQANGDKGYIIVEFVTMGGPVCEGWFEDLASRCEHMVRFAWIEGDEDEGSAPHGADGEEIEGDETALF